MKHKQTPFREAPPRSAFRRVPQVRFVNLGLAFDFPGGPPFAPFKGWGFPQPHSQTVIPTAAARFFLARGFCAQACPELRRVRGVEGSRQPSPSGDPK